MGGAGEKGCNLDRERGVQKFVHDGFCLNKLGDNVRFCLLDRWAKTPIKRKL